LINLQSNALKFTKSGGQVVITAKFVRSVKNEKQNGKLKHNKSGEENILINFVSSSDEEKRSNSSDSDERKFNEIHGIKDIGKKHLDRDKLVIKVQDTGVGIKRQDRLKLFKLFGKL
jgi:signal transduction histidine kinase